MTTIDNSVNPFQQLGLSKTTDTSTSSNSTSLGADAFMKLMIAQMQNQDPTNPMDNSQFLAQLAQFSATSGIQDLQKSFSDLASSMQSYQALQASGLVGRAVLVPSDTAYLPTGGAVYGQTTLDSTTTDLRIGVYDASGQLVRTVDLGMNQSGTVNFKWDGLDDSGNAVAGGTYTLKAEAMVNGKMEAVGTDVYAMVDSVNLAAKNRGIELNLSGMGTVELSQVIQIG